MDSAQQQTFTTDVKPLQEPNMPQKQHASSSHPPATTAAVLVSDATGDEIMSNTEQHGQWVVSRKVDTHVDKKVYRTERVQRRILPEAEWRATFQENPAAVLIDHGGENYDSKKLILGSLTQPVQETRTTARNLNYHPASSADVYVTTEGETTGLDSTRYRRARSKESADNLDLGDAASSRDGEGAACTTVSNDMFVVDEDGRLVRRNTSQVTQQEVTTVTRVYRTLEPVAPDYQLQPSFHYSNQLDDGNNGHDSSRSFEQHFESDGNVYPRAQQERRRSHDLRYERHHQQQYQQQRGPKNFVMPSHSHGDDTAGNQTGGYETVFTNTVSAPDVANEADVLYAARYNYEHYRTAGGSTSEDFHGDTVDFAVHPNHYQRHASSEITEPGYEPVRPMLPPKSRTKMSTSYENNYGVAAAAVHVNDNAVGNGRRERSYDSIPLTHQQQHSIISNGGSPAAAFRHQPSALVDIGYEYDYVTNDDDSTLKRQPVAPNSVYSEQQNGNGLAGEIQRPMAPLQEQQIMPQSPPRPIALRDPELPEVIQFLCHWNAVVRANAAAHLAHLCYMNDAVKAQARSLGVIPLLIDLLVAVDVAPELHKNACCALRNLTYGKANDENKRAFLYAGGVPALARLYARISSTPPQQQRSNGRLPASAVELREAASATLWNLSSCDELKTPIIDEALPAFLSSITDLPVAAAAALQHQQKNGGDGGGENSTQQQNLHYYNHQLSRMFHTAVFRNVSGVLRNVSSDGQHARQALRNGGVLLRALFAYLRMAVGEQDVDNKSTENCVCTVRNLAYRLQEIDDPNYDKQFYSGVGEIIYASPTTTTTDGGGTPSKSSAVNGNNKHRNKNAEPANGRNRSRSGSDPSGPDITCFSTPRQKHKNSSNKTSPKNATPESTAAAAAPLPAASPSATARQVDILWSNGAVKCYLAILQHCANPDTLEAAAGVIQNLTACSWQPSLHVRGLVRKDKGLPILVELLRMENDRVVCSVARGLRNLALDEKNRDLIGKYAMTDLIAKIPTSPSSAGSGGAVVNSDETIAAILATCNECTASNQEFARVFVENDGLTKLVGITQRHADFGPKTVRFATHVLHTLWRRHAGLHELYKSAGFKEAQLLFTPPGYSESSVNTLHRPFSSQGARRDDDESGGGGGSGPGSTGARQQQPSSSAVKRQVPTGQKQLQKQPVMVVTGGAVADPTRHNDSWV